MTVEEAQGAVTLSALVVAGVYGYRRLAEGNTNQASTLTSKTAAKQLAGLGGTPAASHFVVGFGVVYILLSIVAQAAPTLGGLMAILIAVGDLLTNGVQVTKDITGALNRTP